MILPQDGECSVAEMLRLTQDVDKPRNAKLRTGLNTEREVYSDRFCARSAPYTCGAVLRDRFCDLSSVFLALATLNRMRSESGRVW